MNNLRKLPIYPDSIDSDLSVAKNEPTLVDNKVFFFKKKGRFEKVNVDSIIYIQADSNYTYTITEDEKYITNCNLGEMEELFSSLNFMRVHRSYIVNLNNLTAIDLVNNKVFVRNYEIPFSRNLKNELSKKFNIVK